MVEQPDLLMYLSVRLDGEEIQAYPLWDGQDSFNASNERSAIDFAYEAKERHPESHVAIHILNEAPKEESMEAEQIRSTVVVTDAEVAAAAKNIQHGLDEWEAGRMTSPDQRDYVIDCCHVLGIDYGNHPLEIDEIADEIFEDAGEELVTVEAIAKYALTRLKEYDLQPDDPKSEYLVHLNIQLPREKRIEVEQLEREIRGALEVGLGSEEHAPGLQGADVEIALAEEIGGSGDGDATWETEAI